MTRRCSRWVRRRRPARDCVFSVCTGALICGAAGLLQGTPGDDALVGFPPAATVWRRSRSNERVVIDGNLVSAAGVTAGIDGALRVAALLRGDAAAHAIQLYLQYAPEPPFDSGTPETAPAAARGRALVGRDHHPARRRNLSDVTFDRVGLSEPEARKCSLLTRRRWQLRLATAALRAPPRPVAGYPATRNEMSVWQAKNRKNGRRRCVA